MQLRHRFVGISLVALVSMSAASLLHAQGVGSLPPADPPIPLPGPIVQPPCKVNIPTPYPSPVPIMPGLEAAVPIEIPVKPPEYPDCNNGSWYGAGPDIHIQGPHLGDVNIHYGKISLPGPKVHVNVENNIDVSYSEEYYSGHSSGVFYGGGGGYVAPNVGTAPSSIMLAGQPEMVTETVEEQVPTEEEYCEDVVTETIESRAIQAICLDDRGTPHPAARPDPGQSVPANWSGELFRCVAGSQMQVTLTKLGQDNATPAKTFDCKKGEALRIERDGRLHCARQQPRRECNERSLLRRHGPGVKTIHMSVPHKTCVPKTRTVMKTITKEVQVERPVAPTPLALNGGVGQGF